MTSTWLTLVSPLIITIAWKDKQTKITLATKELILYSKFVNNYKKTYDD